MITQLTTPPEPHKHGTIAYHWTKTCPDGPIKEEIDVFVMNYRENPEDLKKFVGKSSADFGWILKVSWNKSFITIEGAYRTIRFSRQKTYRSFTYYEMKEDI